MKTKAVLLFFIIVSMVLSSGFISPASQLIGTITSLVETIQEYPAAINDAYCAGDMVAYRQKLSELASLIVSANHAMEDAKLPNTLNLWAVYNGVIRNLSCGGILTATGYADWSREELDRIGYEYGLFDTVIVPLTLVVSPVDPCLEDPTATGCTEEEDPCAINPQYSPTCTGYDPCKADPQSSPTCTGYDPCKADPQSSPTCTGYDLCKADPQSSADCPGYVNPCDSGNPPTDCNI